MIMQRNTPVEARHKCLLQVIVLFGFTSMFILNSLIHTSNRQPSTASYSYKSYVGQNVEGTTASITSKFSVLSNISSINAKPNDSITGQQSTAKTTTVSSSRNNSSSAYKAVIKVFSLVYFKGGSTFLGRLFASNPNAFYWFEIVQPTYLAMMGLMTIPYDELYTLHGTRRNQTPQELAFIYEHLDKFYNCDLHKLPMDMTYQDSVPLSGIEWDGYIDCIKSQTHQKTWQYFTNQCLKKHLPSTCKTNAGQAVDSDCLNAKFLLDGRVPVKPEKLINQGIVTKMKGYCDCLRTSPLQSAFNICISLAKSQCDKKTIRAVKVMRMRLADTKELVKKDPNFKVIHQLRDPRGALMSAKSIGMFSRHSRKSIVEEAKVVCEKMLEDIRAYKILKENYPSNYIQTKYEDLADHPLETVKLIYEHIGANIPQEVEKHMIEITHAKTEPKGPGALDTHRKDSNKTAHKWRLRMTKRDRTLVDKICLRTIQEGGYKV